MKNNSFYVLMIFVSFNIAFSITGLQNNGATIVVNNNAHLTINGSYNSYSFNGENGSIILDGYLKIKNNLVNNNQIGDIFDPISNDISLYFFGSNSHGIINNSNELSVDSLFIQNSSILTLPTNLSVNVSGDLQLNGSGLQFDLNDNILFVSGNISGNGLVKTTGNSRILVDLEQNVPNLLPLSDGEYNYSIIIEAKNISTLNFGASLTELKNVQNASINPMRFYNLIGEDNLDANIQFRLDKQAIAPNTLNLNSNMRYFDGIRYKIVESFIDEIDDHYIINVFKVNKF